MKSTHTIKVIGTKSHDAIWGEIARECKVETPPAGSITAADFAKTYGLTLSEGDGALRRRVKRGELQTGMFKQRLPVGLRSVRFYWRAAA
jgi:hypothetical protein